MTPQNTTRNLPKQSFGAVLAATLKSEAMGRNGLLRRGWLWVQERRATTRQPRRLKVAATLSLGEKRFVSILECDGLQLLIAGAAGNVTLLTQLPAANTTPHPHAQISPEVAR